MKRTPSKTALAAIKFAEDTNELEGLVSAKMTITAVVGIPADGFDDLGPEYWAEQLAPLLLGALEATLAEGWTQTPDLEDIRRRAALSERYGQNDGIWPPQREVLQYNDGREWT